MPINEPTVEIRQFLGLRNTDRPATLPVGALVDATNIDIDDQNRIERREGYSLLANLTAVTAAHSTRDERDLYIVDGGILKRVVTLSPLVTVAIVTDIPDGEIWWDDHAGFVFCSGALNGIIHGDTFTSYADFGSVDEQTLEVQGETLQHDEADVGTLDPPDNTECVAYFEGSVWLSYYDPVSDQSFIFKSKPFFWSRWDLATDYAAVPGRVVVMGATQVGVLIATDKEIWVYSESLLRRVAIYGAVPGHARELQGQLYFWTKRGLCRVFPFENMTEEGVSVPHGTRAAVGIVRRDGRNTALVVATGGGQADNPYA